MIKRKKYLEELKRYKGHPIAKVITGIRRCGKSTMLSIFAEEILKEEGNSANIISINFDDSDYFDLCDVQSLMDYLKPLLSSTATNYIFLDEIQKVKEFEFVIDSLLLKKNVDLYVTGSNAYFLSSDLATYIAGRYVEIKMLPLSFKEYSDYIGEGISEMQKYENYLKYSSFPQAIFFDNDSNAVRGYIEGVYNTVIVKDVLSRRKIPDKMMLESVVRFMSDNIGNLCSTNSIANTMTSNHRKISVNTVEAYLTGLTESFIIYQ
ncbi:MAG: ATP-binding protein, partial [Anaerovoracaceae bacterium]